MQTFVLLLPNSKFLGNNQANIMANLTADLKVLSFGNSELKTNDSLIYLKRYFVGETTAILLINTDLTKTHKFETIFKTFSLLDKKFDVIDSSHQFPNLKQITVDKYGGCSPTDLYLPANSSILLTYPYVPPGFKELL